MLIASSFFILIEEAVLFCLVADAQVYNQTTGTRSTGGTGGTGGTPGTSGTTGTSLPVLDLSKPQ
jgi:hypothetical protein